MPSPTLGPTATGPSGLAIANDVARLLNEYTGRGPTKARTSFGDDLVTVVIRDLLTKGERSLVRDGRVDLVLDLRRAYQARRATISPTESKRSPDATCRLPQRQPHRPRHRDRELRARPKTTGTIDPQRRRCFLSHRDSARKRSQTCARTVSSCCPSDRDTPCR
jgi:hypothetical protein